MRRKTYLMRLNRKLAQESLKKRFPPHELCHLVPGIRFERKDYSFELWWNPLHKRNRRGLFYVGRIGKRILDQIETAPDRSEHLRQIALTKLEKKRKELKE